MSDSQPRPVRAWWPSPSDENCGQPQFAPPKREGTHDVSPDLRPEAASTRSKRRGRRFDYPAVGAYDLFTANPDGSHVLQATRVPSYCTEWSPDGTRIAFTLIEPDGADQIATMVPD